MRRTKVNRALTFVMAATLLIGSIHGVGAKEQSKAYDAPELTLTQGVTDYDLTEGISYDSEKYTLSVTDTGNFDINVAGDYEISYALTEKESSVSETESVENTESADIIESTETVSGTETVDTTETIEAGLRAQIPTQEKLYAEAEGKAEEILGGAKETAATILDHAGADKERMLKEAEEAGKKILAEADQKAVETIAEADQKAVETITEADQKAGETLTEAERKAGEILAEAGRQAEEILAEAGRQMDVILTKTREKVEKEQALYHQYRSRLEALKNGLDCIFAECPPEEDTRDPQGKPQRPGQIQADGPEEAGLREQP